MSYVILDLEWNGAYSKTAHKYVNEIIEFGAVKLDGSFNPVDSFSALITPKIGKRLCSKVKELTKITNEELKDNGADFLSVAKEFGRFLDGGTLMTWGTSDIHALIENFAYFSGDYHIPFLSSYCDLQEYCQRSMDMYDEGSQMGLGRCAELLGVGFDEDEQHRADADALLSLKCMKKLVDRFPVEPYVLSAGEEAFYERMLFKNHFITDLKSPDIDRSQMRFRCDKCGARTKRVKKWRLRNKSFEGEFVCKSCSNSFTGRIAFKKKYDSVKVNKRIIHKAENESEKSEDNNIQGGAD